MAVNAHPRRNPDSRIKSSEWSPRTTRRSIGPVLHRARSREPALSQRAPRGSGALRYQPQRGGGRVRRAARADRLRQELAAAPCQRSPPADFRRDRGARRACFRGPPRQSVRLRVPGTGAAVWRTALGNVRFRSRSSAIRRRSAMRAARNCWIRSVCSNSRTPIRTSYPAA